MKSVAATMLLGMAVSANAQDEYRGNSTWETPPAGTPIVVENFQDWGSYKDSEGYGQMEAGEEQCATNVRSYAIESITTMKVTRPVGGDGEFVFYLDACAVQAECDTQSGTLNTVNPGVGDDKGPSTQNVSIGGILIYDNYQSQPRPADSGYTQDGKGSFTTCKIPFLETVRYTTSSYGQRRGFLLEIGREVMAYDYVTKTEIETIKWDTLRYFGDPNNRFPVEPWWDEEAMPDLKAYFSFSNAGWVFEDSVKAENVYLRFRPCGGGYSQIVRIHDLQLYGTAPTEILDPYRLPIYPVEPVEEPDPDSAPSIRHAVAYTFANNVFNFSESVNFRLYDLVGKSVLDLPNASGIDLNFLNSGVYIVKAVTASGKTINRKIILK